MNLKHVLICLLLSLTHYPELMSQSSSQDLENITATVNINGLNFPYYDLGEGPVVLLLHGFPDSKYLWRNQLLPLSNAGFRVIAPDLRGFGEAPKPKEIEAYKFSEIFKDILGLLDQLNISKAHIIGHDWGGSLAWAIAGKYPERTLSITGLTVGAPGNPARRSMKQMEKLWYIFFFQSEDQPELWLKRDHWQGLKKWTRGNGDLDRYMIELDKAGALRAGLNWYRANFPAAALNSSSTPPRIKVPSMGISAERDDFLLKEHIIGSEVMIDNAWTYHHIQGASHWLMLDKPEELNRYLIDFLSKVEEERK